MGTPQTIESPKVTIPNVVCTLGKLKTLSPTTLILGPCVVKWTVLRIQKVNSILSNSPIFRPHSSLVNVLTHPILLMGPLSLFLTVTSGEMGSRPSHITESPEDTPNGQPHSQYCNE